MKRCMEHTWTRGRMNDLFERCRWCGETRNLGSNPPSSPVEMTAGSEQRPDHTGVIRGADEADECAHTALSLIYRRERDEALAEVERLTRVTQVIMATGDADHERLSNLLHLTLDERNERDATIERLWAQLNEATNVPDAPTEPTPELERESDAPSAPMCRKHPDHRLQAADDRRAL